MVFSLASVAVACAILDSYSGVEPWSMTTAPIYLKLLTLLTLMSMLMPFVLLVISLDFSALISMPKAEKVLSG